MELNNLILIFDTKHIDRTTSFRTNERTHTHLDTTQNLTEKKQKARKPINVQQIAIQKHFPSQYHTTRQIIVIRESERRRGEENEKKERGRENNNEIRTDQSTQKRHP